MLHSSSEDDDEGCAKGAKESVEDAKEGILVLRLNLLILLFMGCENNHPCEAAKHAQDLASVKAFA